MSIATVPASASVLAPAPRWARCCAHAIALCAVPSGLWRVAMAFGVYVGYSDRVLREEFAIPGWGIAYVLGLSLLAEAAALFPLLLVSERRRVQHPKALAALAWSASAALVLGAIWQLVVACTVRRLHRPEPDAHDERDGRGRLGRGLRPTVRDTRPDDSGDLVVRPTVAGQRAELPGGLARAAPPSRPSADGLTDGPTRRRAYARYAARSGGTAWVNPSPRAQRRTSSTATAASRRSYVPWEPAMCGVSRAFSQVHRG